MFNCVPLSLKSLQLGGEEIWAVVSQEIIKFVAIGCHILRLIINAIAFDWGSEQDAAGGDYSAPPDPLAETKRPIYKGRGDSLGEEKRREVARQGREGSKWSGWDPVCACIFKFALYLYDDDVLSMF